MLCVPCSMKLSKQQTNHIANLARIDFSNKEIDKLSNELSAILDYIEKLESCDTSKVEPTAQVTGLENVMREDKPKIQNPKSKIKILESVPKKKGRYVKVKAVL